MIGSAKAQAPELAPWIVRTGRIGLGVFALVNLVIFVMVFLNPEARSVVPIYREGSLGWWAGRDIFGSGTAGFIYLPSFAVLYTPFALLGPQAGDIAWRIVSAGVVVIGLHGAIRLALPQYDAKARLVLLGTALLILTPGAGNSLRNGQATTILYGLMLWATVAIIEENWWRAGILLALAFALKPLAIVYMLLVVVLRPKLIAPLVVALVVLLALPLVNLNPGRALELYGLGLHKVLAAGEPEAGRWSDITGLFGHFGIVFSETSLTIARIVAAVVTLAVAVIAVRRDSPARAMLNVLALSVVYLMLMSPRTEAQTYLMFSATLALASVLYWHGDGRRKQATVLIVLAVATATGALGTAVMRATDLWFDPLLCVIYLPFLIRDCLFPAAPRLPAAAASGR